jgi:NTE family protein
MKLFVTATSVRTGRGRIFRNVEITPEVLLASSCLPTMFQAIEIDGELYWDGGYAGNPTITPLVRETDAHDSILVQINPRQRKDQQRSAAEILNRLNEISFNSPLMKELRMMALLRQVADPVARGLLPGRTELGGTCGDAMDRALALDVPDTWETAYFGGIESII